MSDFKKLASLLSLSAVVETVSDYEGKKRSDFYPNADEDGMVDVSDYPFTYSTTVEKEYYSGCCDSEIQDQEETENDN